jgi:hypothetical protein
MKVTHCKLQHSDHVKFIADKKRRYVGIDTYQHLSGEITVDSIIKQVYSRVIFMHCKGCCLSIETHKLLQQI